MCLSGFSANTGVEKKSNDRTRGKENLQSRVLSVVLTLSRIGNEGLPMGGSRKNHQPGVPSLAAALSLIRGWLAHHIKISRHCPVVLYRFRQSDVQQAAPNRNGHRMRPVIGSQLAYQVLDVEIDGGFRNCESNGDLLIAKAVSNKAEHL